MTALKELIDRIKEYQEGILALSNENENLEISANAILTATGLILMQAQVLLEREKQQIAHAYELGVAEQKAEIALKSGNEFYEMNYE